MPAYRASYCPPPGASGSGCPPGAFALNAPPDNHSHALHTVSCYFRLRFSRPCGCDNAEEACPALNARNITAHALHTVRHITHRLSVSGSLAAASNAEHTQHERTSGTSLCCPAHTVATCALWAFGGSLRLLKSPGSTPAANAPPGHRCSSSAYRTSYYPAPCTRALQSSHHLRNAKSSSTKSSHKSFFPSLPRRRSFSRTEPCWGLSLKASSQVQPA
jgi:hypothetical protein